MKKSMYTIIIFNDQSIVQSEDEYDDRISPEEKEELKESKKVDVYYKSISDTFVEYEISKDNYALYKPEDIKRIYIYYFIGIYMKGFVLS